jgi:hypothetical protein
MSTEYTSHYGKIFRFNDHICVEMLMGVSDEKRTGRLIQVRKGVGAFGSDLYLVRLRDESLMSFHNVMIRRVDDKRFEFAFYTSNGVQAPVIPPQLVYPSDSPEMEYTIRDEWPEIGFIVDNPKQPKYGQQMFGMRITRK